MPNRQKKLVQCLRRALLCGVALGMAVPVLATAQDASTASAPEQDAPAASGATKDAATATLKAVVVTSQSREQSLQDVPIAVQVVSDAMLDQVTAYDLGDLDAFVPGLEISSDSSAGIQ